MPEGPNIRMWVRKINAYLNAGYVGTCTVARSMQSAGLTCEDDVALLRVWSLGKNMFFDLDNGLTIHFHMMMSRDALALTDSYKTPPSCEFFSIEFIHTSDQGGEEAISPLYLCGYKGTAVPSAQAHLCTREQLDGKLSKLGVDIMDPKFGEFVLPLMVKSKASVSNFLMDQSKCCGVGNILRSEVMHLANLPPNSSMKDLDDQSRKKLTEAIQQAANEMLRGDTPRVYKQKECEGRTVHTSDVNGRTLYSVYQ